MSQDNISRLCLDETELFQKLLCPMVVNLPMLVSKPDGEVMKDEFILDGALYTRLCEGDGQWTYVNNIYSCENGKPENADQVRGYLNCDVICDYLSFNNPLVERLKSSFLQSMVIKCKRFMICHMLCFKGIIRQKHRRLQALIHFLCQKCMNRHLV